MGWLRLVAIGCLKFQVIFRKRANNYRALLRKMTYNDKASYGSSPPCTMICGGFTGQEQLILMTYWVGHIVTELHAPFLLLLHAWCDNVCSVN